MIGLLGVILVLVAAVVAAFFYGKRFPQAAPAELAPKIAVADVRNLSGADDLTYFADGLTHQIIDRLMRYDSFSITALPDAETVLTTETLAALRSEHGITHVASGSLMPGGGDADLRFLVQLYRTDGQIVWSGTYGGEMTARSMQHLQDSIATQVAGVRDDDLRGPAEMSSNGGSAVGDILLAIAQHRAGAGARLPARRHGQRAGQLGRLGDAGLGPARCGHVRAP